MKSLKKLIVPLIILVAVGIAYLGAKKIAEKAEALDTEPIPTEYTVLDIDASEIKSVAFKSGDCDISIDCSNDYYYLSSDRTFPLNQTAAKYFIEAVTDLTSTVAINGTDNMAEYGLDKPQATVTVVSSKGTDVIKVGSFNKYSSSYYCSLNGENTVCSLPEDFLDSFNYSLDDLIVNETVTKPTNGISDVIKISVEKPEETLEYRFVKGTDDELDEEGNVVTEGTDDSFDLYDADGNLVGDATEKAGNIYNAVVGSSYNEWIDYGVTEEDELDKYGLLNPAYRVIITYNEEVTISSDDSSSSITKIVEKTSALLIGNRIQTEESVESETADTPEEGENESPEYDRYVLIDGGKIVYVLSEKTLEDILG